MMAWSRRMRLYSEGQLTEVVGVLDTDEDADVKLAHVAAGSGDTYAGSFSAIPGLSSSEVLESWLLQRGVTFRLATGHFRQEQCPHMELESWSSLSELQQQQEEREWRTREPERLCSVGAPATAVSDDGGGWQGPKATVSSQAIQRSL